MSFSDRLLLFLAQGLNVGRISWMPGTFGTLLGVAWFFILLLPASKALFLVGMIAAIIVCVPVCTRAEDLLKRSDPGSVVLDEIVAVPICFISWTWHYADRHGNMPSMEFFWAARSWFATIGVFLLFRLFDIWKPWPVNRSQHLPKGLGVTADDILAAIYVNIVVQGFIFAGWWPS